MHSDLNLKRPLLYSLIVSVVLGALLGIVVVLRGSWGWFEVRVILTTLTIAVASLCGLACDLSRAARRGSNILPNSGLALTLVVAAMTLGGMWLDIDSSVFWKATAVASVFAAATIQTCLLSIATLYGNARWVFVAACVVAFGLASFIAAIILGEIDDDFAFRIMIALAIVDGAFTLVIPMLHRIGRTSAATSNHLPREHDLAEIDRELSMLRRRMVKLEELRAARTRRASSASE